MSQAFLFRRLSARCACVLTLAGFASLAGAGARGPILLSSAGAARLELASGDRVSARLPDGASLEATAALDHGWLAAGTQPAASGAPGRDLLLLTGEGTTVATLAQPSGRTGALRQEPLPLVEDGRLAGLAWLEGPDRRSFAVRFAAWNGAGWDAPETVAPPGPGSQLALTAARLADGTWLLAWSSFDGHDDEIVWTRGRAGAWSRPRRVAADNGVPDITPSLTAAGDGALLAWSRYDDAAGAAGGYRVVVSRLKRGTDGIDWTAPVAAGPAGSLYPTFEPAEPGRARMLFKTADPRGWQVLDLDASGHVLRHAFVKAATAATSERPVVDATAAGAAFRWPSAAGLERLATWETGDRRP